MQAKYDTIGKNYNRTRKPDPFLVSRLIHHLNPKPEGLYLDIGCGTGNYTDVLQRKGSRFIGIDPSVKMLNKARLQNPNIDWREGTAEQTGLADHTVDGIIASLTIHHWTDMTAGFRELTRVLKPDGNLVLFTSTPAQMRGYWLNEYFPNMLQDSILQMPSLDRVTQAMTDAGFEITSTENYDIKPDLEDQFLYCGKYDPTLYLDPSIRNGISSFSHLANQKEVQNGLAQLEKDITSGKIKDIMASYKNDLGDYLYINTRKRKV